VARSKPAALARAPELKVVKKATNARSYSREAARKFRGWVSQFGRQKAFFVRPRDGFALPLTARRGFLGFAKIPKAMEKDDYGNEIKIWIAAAPFLPAGIGGEVR
jgi:hypothetical protein